MKTDVLIIGGGVTGVAVARELSKYDAETTLVEREVDVGWGQSKASYALRHPGVQWPPGSLAQQMIAHGNQLMDQLIEDLDIEFKRSGELVLAFNREEVKALETMQRRGNGINVQGISIMGKNDISRLEPNASEAAIAALYMPTAGVFNPFDLLHGFCENARDNGVNMLMGARVEGISPERSGFRVKTSRGEIRTAYIVNAAGLFAAKVAAMAGIDEFEISSETKGSCLVIDSLLAHKVRHIVTGLIDPGALLRFKLATPTFHGKILLYTAMAVPSKGIEDRSVDKVIFDSTIRAARGLIPGVDFEKHIIAAFAGLTARNNRGDFIIEPSGKYNRFIHAALPPPGLTASPAVGRRVVEVLKSNGLALREKTGFNPRRRRIESLRDSTPARIEELVKHDPRYGRVVCRCEKVSEAEVIEAIRRGATTIDGVKFRTRASMGRCQGNYCGPELARILANQTEQSFQDITRRGGNSHYANPVHD